MRKSAIVSGMFHIFISAAVLLWLLWYFFPVAIWVKGLATLVIVMVACGLVWQRRRPDAVSTLAASDLPLIENQSPVVLVCGDGLGDLFPEQPLRKTGQGCWLRVGDVGALTDVVRNIQAQQPRQLGQLSIMYNCLPDQHQDEAVLRASLKTLRQQVRQLHLLTGFRLPVVLNGQFSGPETPWNIVRGDEAVVSPANEALISLQEWQLTAGNSTIFPVLGQAFTFIREILLDELEKADRLCPPVHPLRLHCEQAIREGTTTLFGVNGCLAEPLFSFLKLGRVLTPQIAFLMRCYPCCLLMLCRYRVGKPLAVWCGF